jgi:hypothetical protein
MAFASDTRLTANCWRRQDVSQPPTASFAPDEGCWPRRKRSATGTRNLSEAGKKAIEDLFARLLEGERADASKAGASA